MHTLSPRDARALAAPAGVAGSHYLTPGKRAIFFVYELANDMALNLSQLYIPLVVHAIVLIICASLYLSSVPEMTIDAVMYMTFNAIVTLTMYGLSHFFTPSGSRMLYAGALAFFVLLPIVTNAFISYSITQPQTAVRFVLATLFDLMVSWTLQDLLVSAFRNSTGVLTASLGNPFISAGYANVLTFFSCTHILRRFFVFRNLVGGYGEGGGDAGGGEGGGDVGGDGEGGGDVGGDGEGGGDCGGDVGGDCGGDVGGGEGGGGEGGGGDSSTVTMWHDTISVNTFAMLFAMFSIVSILMLKVQRIEDPDTARADKYLRIVLIVIGYVILTANYFGPVADHGENQLKPKQAEDNVAIVFVSILVTVSTVILMASRDTVTARRTAE